MTDMMAPKEMGSSGMTFQYMLDFTHAAILRADILSLYNVLRKSLLDHHKNKSKQNELDKTKAYQQYARAIWKRHIGRIHIRGYKTKFALYDGDGTAYFDSDYTGWKVVAGDALTQVDLVPTQYYERSLGSEKCALIHLNRRKQVPFLLNRKHPTTQLPQSGLMHSQYVVDPRETMESIMSSVSNICHHPIDMPHYMSVRHGMSARPAFPGKGQQGYYVCCNIGVLVADEQGKEQCIANFFVRLGIEQEIDDPFTTMLAHSSCSTCEDGDWSIRTR